MAVVLLRNHRPRMDQLIKVGLEQGVGDLKAKDLDPARGRARATADEAQVEEQHQREIAPQAVVAQRETGRGHHRSHVQRHMPQRVVPRQVGGGPIPTAQHQPGHQQQADKALHLLVLEQRPAMAAPSRDIQGKRQTAEDHHHNRHPMYRRLRPFRQ